MIKKLIALWRIAEIKFTGYHGWYMAFQSRGTIDWNMLVNDALKNTTHDADEFMAAHKLVVKQIQEYLARGYRCDIGDEFMVAWPNIIGKVMDRIDPSTGQTIVATPDDLKKVKPETKISC